MFRVRISVRIRVGIKVYRFGLVLVTIKLRNCPKIIVSLLYIYK